MPVGDHKQIISWRHLALTLSGCYDVIGINCHFYPHSEKEFVMPSFIFFLERSVAVEVQHGAQWSEAEVLVQACSYPPRPRSAILSIAYCTRN